MDHLGPRTVKYNEKHIGFRAGTVGQSVGEIPAKKFDFLVQ
jgi:hypothetical protein